MIRPSLVLGEDGLNAFLAGYPRRAFKLE